MLFTETANAQELDTFYEGESGFAVEENSGFEEQCNSVSGKNRESQVANCQFQIFSTRKNLFSSNLLEFQLRVNWKISVESEFLN